MQEPAAPQVFDNALPTPGLQAHTVVSRFVDHVPYYRQEQINARAGVHTPRSTLAAWSGQTGAQLMPLYDAHRAFVLGSRVLHADETPIALLDPGAGKTKKAYMWAYARGAFEPDSGVVFDFCGGRGGKYPIEFLTGWTGTLVVDAYSGYDAALALDGRSAAYRLGHAPGPREAQVRRTGQGQRERGGGASHPAHRLAVPDRGRRQGADPRAAAADAQAAVPPAVGGVAPVVAARAHPVPDGSAIAKAIAYSLNHWVGLGRFLHDVDVLIDNNCVENRIPPWALGRRNWLFIGSQLAGERAAVVMSLLQSAKLNGHEPWACLKDVLTRLPTQLNSRIEELLPHRWQPAGGGRPA